MVQKHMLNYGAEGLADAVNFATFRLTNSRTLSGASPVSLT